MIMGIIKTTTYECDLCGKQSEHSDFNNGNESGNGSLKLTGNRGAVSYGGDWGGSNYSIKKILCFSCADKVIDYIKQLESTFKR